MTEQAPAAAYTTREATHSAVERRLDRWSLWLGIGRLILGSAVLGFAIQVGLSFAWAAAALGVFVVLSVAQGARMRRRDWHRSVASINRRELLALRGEAPFGDAFEAPPGPEHRYADDLELFSEHGLFRFLSRTATPMGSRVLADWLLAPAHPTEICARQDAVRELAFDIDHRQTLAAHALPAGGRERQARATRVLAGDAKEQGRIELPYFLCLGIPIATVGLGLASSLQPRLLTGFLSLVAVQALLYLFLRRRIRRLLRDASGCAGALKAYAAMLHAIEIHASRAPRLRELQGRLRAEGVQASAAIRRLGSLLEWMDVRSSPMLHGPLNLLLLWDINGAKRLSDWQRRFHPSIGAWLNAIGEWEALCSFATIAFNHSRWVWPDVRYDGPGLRAEALGHPLIDEAECVPADVHLPTPGSIWIVTGPNMAGKSTFLRTVGVGLVMAQAGAPVCARRFELSPQHLISSMHISDSLDKKLSLFYAELQRLKQILDAVDAGEPVFFLIDEMLKGTNTLDRQAGAIALVRQLQRARVLGIVATHDLALARLAAENPDSIANFHFDGTVLGDRLVFDYRLRDGACERFNALSLMRAIGIRLDEEGRTSLQDPA